MRIVEKSNRGKWLEESFWWSDCERLWENVGAARIRILWRNNWRRAEDFDFGVILGDCFSILCSECCDVMTVQFRFTGWQLSGGEWKVDAACGTAEATGQIREVHPGCWWHLEGWLEDKLSLAVRPSALIDGLSVRTIYQLYCTMPVWRCCQSVYVCIGGDRQQPTCLAQTVLFKERCPWMSANIFMVQTSDS